MRIALLLLTGASLLIATPDVRGQEATPAVQPVPAGARSGVERVRQRLSRTRPPAYVIVVPQQVPAPPQPVTVNPSTGERIRYVPVPYAVPSGNAPTPQVVRVERPAGFAPAPGVFGTPDSSAVTDPTIRPSLLLPNGVAAQPRAAIQSVQEVERALFETGLFRAVGVNFEFGKSGLLEGADVLVDPVGEVLQRYPTLQIEVAGHTDSIGSDDFNQQLSEARAQTIAAYLVERWGIDPARLTATGYGETLPLVSNDNPTGRTLNRRVEFRVVEMAP